MKEEKTNGGFDRIEFEDLNGVKCSIQKSSLATDDAIWLGANEIGLQEFVAYRNPAWQDVQLERSESHHFNANNRIHLTREIVDEILPYLFNFSLTGDLVEDEADAEDIRQVMLAAVAKVENKDSRLASLEAENKRLREALSVYANEFNWYAGQWQRGDNGYGLAASVLEGK